MGGHVEPGESLEAALRRELGEETGWELDRVLGLQEVVDWESRDAGVVRPRREFVLVLTVKTPWSPPRLETTKVTEGRWFGPHELAILNENLPGTDSYVHDLAARLFESRLYREFQEEPGPNQIPRASTSK